MALDDDRLDVRRLAIVLGQLQSVHDHEVLNAARAATRMVREASTTWAAVLGDGLTADTSDPRQIIHHDQRGSLAPPIGRSWADTVRWLAARRAGVTACDNEMLDRLCRSLSRPYRQEAPHITPDEAAWVTDIYDAIGRPTSFPREEIA